MWMLIPLSFSTFLILQMVPGLEGYEEENYRSQILSQGLLAIQNEAYVFAISNQNFVGSIPVNAFQIQSQVEWHAEIVNDSQSRFVLTWFLDFEIDHSPIDIHLDHQAMAESGERPGFFWGQYTSQDVDTGLVGTIVVPKPGQSPGEGTLIVGDLI